MEQIFHLRYQLSQSSEFNIHLDVLDTDLSPAPVPLTNVTELIFTCSVTDVRNKSRKQDSTAVIYPTLLTQEQSVCEVIPHLAKQSRKSYVVNMPSR